MKLPLYFSTHHGTTLLELLVSLAIVAIVGQISLSYLPNFLALNRVSNQVSLLHKNINYARLYAIEKNSYVTLCALKSNKCTLDNWHNQLAIFVDNDKSTSLGNDEQLISTFEHTNEADTLTYPRDAITLPYLVAQKIGPSGPTTRDLAATNFSAIALDIPIALMG